MTGRSVLVAHPSADVYGADLQLVESVRGFTAAGDRVTVFVPGDGPLVARLAEAGAAVVPTPFPVLRKSFLSPKGLAVLGLSVLRRLPGMVRRLRRDRPDVVLVNTVTVPWWLLAARLAGRRAVCHVHEAEEDGRGIVLRALNAPISLAHTVVVNSHASAAALTRWNGRIADRVVVVHNGVSGPADEPAAARVRAPGDPARLALVARLSPRKGVDVALDAVGLLREEGRDVSIVVCGSTFEGYEWFESDLRERAQRPDLAGAVTLDGYVNPTWPVLADADVVLVPSRVEPFGNTAVEALLARRPLVASDVQGLAEIVRPGETGLLATPGDASSLAAAIARTLDDPDAAARRADAGRADALERFSPQRYASSLRAAALG